MKKQTHLFISGAVQGVFFRASVATKARNLGLAGWVRNLPNSSVELIAEGEETKLKQLIEWCRMGPPAARVEHVDISWGEVGGNLKAFQIR